jgi:hypothetical protein|nr:MAG TPA: Nucleotide modification associated domain 1 [Caudoviricetes sp.]
MGKKKKKNNKRVNPPEINKRILNGFLDMKSDAGNMMELFGGFWPLIEKKEQDMLNIRDRTKVPQLDFRKIIGNKQPSGTKIAKYMEGEINVSKFSAGQVVKLKDYDALKLVNDSLIYHLEEYDLKRISDAQVAIYKVHNTRQLHKSGKPVFWYEVGQWGRNIVDVPEDFLEELPEPVNIPSDNEEGEKQQEIPVEETMDEMVEKFEEVLHELVPYDKMEGEDPNLYHIRIGNLFKPCFMKKTSNPEKIECLMHITSIARAAYQHYAQVTLSMAEISQEQLYTYRKKNADYGNAFEKSMDEDGILVAKIRIGDKIRRINSLIKNNGEGQVKDERLEDTYLDLANYCVMTILWIRKQQSK